MAGEAHIPGVNSNHLLEQFRQGDPNAFYQVYSNFYGALWYFAHKIIHNKEEAEDIVADSFVKLWNRQQAFQSLESIKAFLYVATRNACFDWLKHVDRKSANLQQIKYLQEKAEDSIQADIIKADLLQKTLLEVEALPAQMQKVFRMIFVEGLSTSEIAVRLNISIDTVRVQKANALKAIRVALIKKGLLSSAASIALISLLLQS